MTEMTEEPRLPSATPREVAKRFFTHENAVIAIILVVLVAILQVLTKGAIVTRANIANVVLQSSTRGLAAIGEAFVILTAGIDASIGGLGLMTTIIGATLMSGSTAFPIGPILVMLLVSTGVGALSGSLVSRIGIPALIVTLGMWQMTEGAALAISGGVWQPGVPDSFSNLITGNVAGVPVPAIIFIVSAVVAHFTLYYTTYGKSVFAVGGSQASAWLSGIRVKNILHSVYMVSGFMTGLAALVQTGRMAGAGMGGMEGLEIDAIASCVIGGISLSGGRGTLIGVVIGVMMIGVVNNGLNILLVDPSIGKIIKGIIIISAVGIDYLRRRGH